MNLQYENVVPVTKDQALTAFESGDANRIAYALLGVAFHEPDWEWVEDQCLHYLESEESAVRNAAIACLGHLARIHKKINKAKVMSALRSHLNDEGYQGRVEDAIDDIEMFARQS